jgi:NAD(P)-dependent dehydrogenase (short-subunit alcohol dehydrogenase family)
MTAGGAPFAGQVAVVTGGGGGIGRATAQRFAAQGARVAVVDLDAATAAETVDAIASDGGEAASYAVDVSAEAEVAELVASVVRRWGRIDVLHNNAALLGGAGDQDIADVDVAAWDTKLAVNLRGVMLGCKHAVPVMRAAGRGAIVNTSSVSGLTGTSTNAAYGASKAAIVNLTRSVAAMVGRDGIRCNAVAPGLVLTDRLAAALSERQLRLYAAERLLPWAATPDDVAATVVWLAGDEARAITGQTIVVDSGTTSHRPRDSIEAWERGT